MTMRHLFGPILSRRLGHSLGINLVPRKTCNYSCVYCQLGATGKTTGEIREHVPLEEVKEDLELFFSKPHPETDILTLIGDGEPLLFSPLGELVDFIKARYSLPTALITNGSLLALEERRRASKRVDLLLLPWTQSSRRLGERSTVPGKASPWRLTWRASSFTAGRWRGGCGRK